MYDAKQYVDRKFNILLEDAVFFIEEAEQARCDSGKWTGREGAFARSSVMNSVLLLEAAANAVIDTLKISTALFNDIDRLTVISKFEYYLQASHPHLRLDRGILIVQQAQELVGVRNYLVHPRPFSSDWKRVDDRTLTASLGETQFLKLPRSFVFLKASDAVLALKAALGLLNYFFRDLCKYKDERVRKLLTSECEHDSPVGIGHDHRWIEWSDRWGLEVDFLVDVQWVKKMELEMNALIRATAQESKGSGEPGV